MTTSSPYGGMRPFSTVLPLEAAQRLWPGAAARVSRDAPGLATWMVPVVGIPSRAIFSAAPPFYGASHIRW